MNALLYGISIIIIYVGLGFIVTKLLGADALNEMASNAFFNLAFFVIFVIFAISFFGYFEITLPSSFVNKMDSMSDRGGLIGIFFMAFTLSLISFSCTGPIIGTLLVEAAVGGSNSGPLIGMFGFSLALALPFGLFAAFPGWLNTLPKSGGWLNSVKVVLGFLELGLALKFLSNVDLAYHWGFLKREIFLGIWLVIAVATGLYILGKIKFPHDSPVNKISPARWFFASIFFAFALYLIPGLKGANLKLLSGFPPPAFYSIFETKSKCPHDINCFKDLNEGLAFAKRVNKPVMLDFTGWSCVNCRKMEENVWVEPEILSILKDDYVLISLYVDDKTELPEAEQKVSDCTGKKIRTIGNKWSEYQTCTFKTNTQPYYVLMNTEGKVLNEPVGYMPDANKYKNFLEDGLKKF
jgi:thiol:disulfide interchange protein DsbD